MRRQHLLVLQLTERPTKPSRDRELQESTSMALRAAPRRLVPPVGKEGERFGSALAWLPDRDGDSVAAQLVQYNERRRHLDFCRSSHRCGVCLEERLGAEMHVLQPCGHQFCRACIRGLCELHVREGSVDRLQCPEPSCRAELGPGLLRRVLSEDLFLRWESLSLQKALEAMPTLCNL